MFGSNGVEIFKNGSVVAEDPGMCNTPILEFKAFTLYVGKKNNEYREIRSH